MKKKLNEMSITELKMRYKELKQTIDICEAYLTHCPNTFLGPLGAKAEIKKCNKEKNFIKKMLEELN